MINLRVRVCVYMCMCVRACCASTPNLRGRNCGRASGGRQKGGTFREVRETRSDTVAMEGLAEWLHQRQPTATTPLGDAAMASRPPSCHGCADKRECAKYPRSLLYKRRIVSGTSLLQHLGPRLLEPHGLRDAHLHTCLLACAHAQQTCAREKKPLDAVLNIQAPPQSNPTNCYMSS